MDSTYEKQKNTAVFKEALTPEEWEAELENAYNRTKGKYKVPGFRPGKAPRKLIETHYGAGVFFDAALDFCVDRVYRQEIANHPEIDVYGRPEVAFDKAEDGMAIAFTITATLYPELKLAAYKGIKLPKIEYNVTDDDVNARIKSDLEQAARSVPVERPAANGDVVVIDYVGTVDGVEFEGGKAEKHELKLGSGAFIPGFEDGLIGAVKGEKRDVKVKFPEEYHAENLKGKDAVFQVTVNEVMAEEIPELTEEFVAERGRYGSVEEYKTGVRAALEKQAASRERNDRIDAIMKSLLDGTEAEFAEKIIDDEVENIYADFVAQMSQYGIRPEDYLKYNDSSVEQFRTEQRPHAERNVKMRRIMLAIIEAEKITVMPEEITQKLRDPAARMQLDRVARANGGRVEDYAYNELLTDKFFDFLLANNEFVLEQAANEEQTPSEQATEEKPAAKKPSAKKRTTKKSE